MSIPNIVLSTIVLNLLVLSSVTGCSSKVHKMTVEIDGIEYINEFTVKVAEICAKKSIDSSMPMDAVSKRDWHVLSFRDGKALGLKLLLSDRDPLHKLGLRSGDIVVTVGGLSVSKLDNIERINTILREKLPEDIQVVFERNGSRKTMNIILDKRHSECRILSTD